MRPFWVFGFSWRDRRSGGPVLAQGREFAGRVDAGQGAGGVLDSGASGGRRRRALALAADLRLVSATMRGRRRLLGGTVNEFVGGHEPSVASDAR